MSQSTVSAPGRRPVRLKRPIRRTPLQALAFLGLGVVAVVLVLALALGQYIVRSAYQAGHQPTPTDAAEGMLDATLHDRDPSSVGKYMCNAAVERKIDDQIQRIKDFTKSGRNSIDYSWDTRQAARSGDRATVIATIDATVTQNGVLSADPPQRWTLAMRDRSGWKVCGLTIG